MMTVPLATLLFLAGCRAPLPPVAVDVSKTTPAVDYSRLDTILHQAVDFDRDVLPEPLKKNRDTLDAQLRLLAVTGPTATPALLPAPADRQAYWLNAHAAWSLKLFLEQDTPKQLDLNALHHRPFTLDGRMMTLQAVEQELADLGDFRLAVLAPCVCLSHGEMLEHAVQPDQVKAFLDEGFNRYVIDNRRFTVDIDLQQIGVAPALWAARPMLIRNHERKYGLRDVTFQTTLLPYTTGRAQRRLQDAIGYKIAMSQPSAISALVDELKKLR